MAILGVIALSPIVASALPPSGTVVVSASQMAGWTIQLDTSTVNPPTASTAFVAGPGLAPSGAGSAALGVGADGDGGVQLRNPGYVGTLFSDVTALSYSTYVSVFNGCQAPYLILSLDYTGDGVVDDALFFEPCYQSGTYGGDAVPAQGVPVLNTWQTWNALEGGWWAYNANTWGPPLTTISSYIASHPGTQIVNSVGGAGGVRFAAGYGAGAWDNFIGNVDSFTIGVGAAVTTFDFEPSPGPAHLDVGSNGVYDFDFPTIQGAVNAANAGDTVRVDAGTYSELVVITKTMTLKGAQAGTTACGRSSLESIVGTPNGAFQILADNVVIDGFTITGVDGNFGISSLGAGIWTTGANSGHVIRDNIIMGNTMGVYLNSNGASPSFVEDNQFASNNVAGAASGNGIYSDQGANDITIRDNCFTGHDNAAMLFAGGAWLGNTQSGITVSGNTFDNDAGGVVFWFASGITITGNTWRDSLGTSVFLGGNVDGVTITENTFDSAAYRGIRILAGAIGIDTTPDTNVVVNFNNFLDNAMEGLRVDGASYSGTLDATCNWWGDSSGPFITSNPALNPAATGDEIDDADGVVSFIPWLGTPTPNPCSGPVHLDIGSNGVYDVNFGTIQPAVTTANSGDTVYVDPGTYTEQVVIDAGIRLLPTVPGSLPTIRAPPFASRSTFTILSSGRTWDAIVELKADDASIEGFNIDGFGRGGFCSGRSFTGIMMHGALDMAAIGNTVTGIRDEPFSGCQAGIGIAMYADTVGNPTTGEISGNTIMDYQKGGIVVNIEGAMATVDRNLVEGVGPTHVIAQNGIQFGFGAGGVASANTVRGHAYDDGYWTSAGILLYEAAPGTLVDSNTAVDNQVGIDVWFSTDATVQFNDVRVGSAGLFSACGGSLGAIDLFGIHFQDSDGTIEGNSVDGIAFQAGARGCQSGDGIVLDESGTVLVTGNVVTGYQKNGIMAGRISNGVPDDGVTAAIEHNAVVGWGMTDLIAQNGIEVADGAQATVTNNEVSGNWYSPCGDYLTCYNAAGILLYRTSHTVVGTNLLSGNQAGVNLFLAHFADIGGNTITGSAWGIIVDTSNDVSVHGNTIGVPTVGPNALQVIGIWALNSVRVEVTGNVINFGGAVDPVSTLYGISFEGASGRVVSNDVLNVRMAAPNFGVQTGVGIVATGIGTLWIEDNTVSNYQKGGIVVGRFGNGLGNDPVIAVILGNRVTGVGPTDLIAQNGIQVADTAYAVVSLNTVSGNTYTGGFWTSAGILLYLAASGIQVTGNSLTGNQAGIYVFHTDNVFVAGNDIHFGALGIVVDSSNGAYVLGNTIDHPVVVPNEPEVIGIWAIDALNLRLSANIIDFGGAVGVVPTLRGISLESSSGSILGNTVRGVRMAGADFSRLTGIGIVATGTGDLRIADNTVRNYQWGGIFIGLPDSPYTGRVDIVNNLVRGVGPTRLIRQIGVLISGPGVSGSVRGNFIADNCFLGTREHHGDHDGHDDDDHGHHDNDDRDRDERDHDGRGKCRGDAEVKDKDKKTCPPGVAVGLLLCNVNRDALEVSRNRFSGNQVDILRVRT